MRAKLRERQAPVAPLVVHEVAAAELERRGAEAADVSGVDPADSPSSGWLTSVVPVIGSRGRWEAPTRFRPAQASASSR